MARLWLVYHPLSGHSTLAPSFGNVMSFWAVSSNFLELINLRPEPYGRNAFQPLISAGITPIDMASFLSHPKLQDWESWEVQDPSWQGINQVNPDVVWQYEVYVREQALLISLGLFPHYLGLTTQTYNSAHLVLGQLGLPYRTNIRLCSLRLLCTTLQKEYSQLQSLHAHELAGYQDQY